MVVRGRLSVSRSNIILSQLQDAAKQHDQAAQDDSERTMINPESTTVSLRLSVSTKNELPNQASLKQPLQQHYQESD